MPNKVIFPINDSDTCKSGIRWAKTKLIKPSDEIIVVTLNDNPMSNSASKLVEFFKVSFFSNHADVKTHVLPGSDLKIVKDFINSSNADFCVIGSRGNKGMKKIASGGSFAEYLLKNSTVPLLVSKHDITHMEISPVRKICFPLDNSDRAFAALKWSFDHILQNDDQVSLITVSKEGKDLEANKFLEACKDELSKSCSIDCTVLNGDVRAGILNYLNTKKPDICIIGTRGLKGVQRIFAGSVSEFILNSVEDIPVLILH